MKKKLKYKTVYVEDIVPGNPVFSKEALKKSQELMRSWNPGNGQGFTNPRGGYCDQDGFPIQLIKHPGNSLWNRIKAFFIRPKFSKEALEPAEELKDSNQI